MTVITRDTAAFQNPASDVLLKSFRNELSRNGAKIDVVQSIAVDPLRPGVSACRRFLSMDQ